ncbi:MAG: tetratricopeptide repeat protein [Nitrospirae bacterium]|nr:tetratricopeptide repeat protein [Nitrospirota bacterium]
MIEVWNPDDFSDDPICKKKVVERYNKINNAYDSLYDYYSPHPYLPKSVEVEKSIKMNKKRGWKKLIPKKAAVFVSIILISCIAVSAYFYNKNYSNVRSVGDNAINNSQTADDNSLSEMQTEKRVALVIGNGDYKNIKTLRNPVNDAKAMAEVLRELNFEVITDVNLFKDEMIKLVRTFGDKIKYGGVGLFYFAGHGVQVNGKNYLIPVNANIDSQEVVETEAVDADYILARMDAAKNRLNIVILDACRDNPFKGFRSVGGGGLAMMNAPRGTFIAYATSPGSVASDGDGQHGLFTQAMINSMNKSGLKIEEMFKEVSGAVQQASNEKQTPWIASNITGDFYFKLGTNSNGSKDPSLNTVIASKNSNPEVTPSDNKAIKLNPQDAKAYFDRGVSYGKLGNYQQAINDYNKAIELNPQFANAYVHRGNSYADLHNYQQSISDYNKAIELNPQDVFAYYNRGDSYYFLGNYQQAISDYTKAIELDPQFAIAYDSRGLSYYFLGNYQQAISDYTKAIELNPQFTPAYYNRGLSYSKLGNYQQATNDYKIAARLGDKEAQDFLSKNGFSW